MGKWKQLAAPQDFFPRNRGIQTILCEEEKASTFWAKRERERGDPIRSDRDGRTISNSINPAKHVNKSTRSKSSRIFDWCASGVFIHNDRLSAAAKFFFGRARTWSEGALGVSTLCGASRVWAKKSRDRGRCSRAGQGMAGGAHDRYGTAERPPLGGRYRPWGIAHMGGIPKGPYFANTQQQQVKCGIGFHTFALQCSTWKIFGFCYLLYLYNDYHCFKQKNKNDTMIRIFLSISKVLGGFFF